jgi:hypothetical protein
MRDKLRSFNHKITKIGKTTFGWTYKGMKKR